MDCPQKILNIIIFPSLLSSFVVVPLSSDVLYALLTVVLLHQLTQLDISEVCVIADCDLLSFLYPSGFPQMSAFSGVNPVGHLDPNSPKADLFHPLKAEDLLHLLTQADASELAMATVQSSVTHFPFLGKSFVSYSLDIWRAGPPPSFDETKPHLKFCCS